MFKLARDISTLYYKPQNLVYIATDPKKPNKVLAMDLNSITNFNLESFSVN